MKGIMLMQLLMRALQLRLKLTECEEILNISICWSAQCDRITVRG